MWLTVSETAIIGEKFEDCVSSFRNKEIDLSCSVIDIDEKNRTDNVSLSIKNKKWFIELAKTVHVLFISAEYLCTSFKLILVSNLIDITVKLNI